MISFLPTRTARLLFWCLAAAGRPCGGVRPRRLIHWLSHRAFERPPAESEFGWHLDHWGNRFLLHPYYLLDRQIIAFGAYDYPLHAFIEQRIFGGMVCLDIGANIGAVSLHLASRVGLSGLVYCFEPLPHLYKRLIQNALRHDFAPAIDARQVAVSDQDGETILSSRPQDHPNQGMGSIVNQDCCLKIRVPVLTVTLDTFVESVGLKKIDFIKLDVQGAEPLVLEGAKRTLNAHQPDMLLEVSAWDLRAGGKSPPALLSRLEELGYECFMLTRSGRVGKSVRSAEVRAEFSCNNLYCRCIKASPPAATPQKQA